jgi:hypothetical protein
MRRKIVKKRYQFLDGPPKFAGSHKKVMFFSAGRPFLPKSNIPICSICASRVRTRSYKVIFDFVEWGGFVRDLAPESLLRQLPR